MNDALRRNFLSALALVSFAAMAYLAWLLRTELVLLFAAGLFGVTLYTMSRWLTEKTRIPHAISLVLWSLVILGFFAGFFMFVSQRLSDEYQDLENRIPSAMEELEARLEGVPLLSSLGAQIGNIRSGMAEDSVPASPPSASDQEETRARQIQVLRVTVSGVAGVVIVAMVAFFLALGGEKYMRGVLLLVPPERRPVAEDLLASLNTALPRWIVGRLASMAVVAVLVAVGLFIIGVPLALVLGIIAGLFSFVPLLGPIASLIPAGLVALESAPDKLIWVLVLYGGVQFVESNIITPRIQQSVASVPPAVLIASQLIMGVLVGLVGVMFSTPLALTAMVAVQVLYLRHGLGEEVSTPGR